MISRLILVLTFVAKMDQSKQRSISNIEVSENSFKVTTYLYNRMIINGQPLDEFTINKSVGNKQSRNYISTRRKQQMILE